MICLADLVVALIRTRMGKELELVLVSDSGTMTHSSKERLKLETEIDLLNSLVESLVN